MRQIEDARKKYEEIPIPQELSGRVRAAIVRSEEKRKSGLLYTSPSPRDLSTSRMPSSA